MLYRTSLGSLLVVLALTFASGTASAHAHLKAADPEKNATLKAAPSHVALTFSEPVELAFSSVTITAPDTTKVSAGEASHGKDSDAHVLEVPITMPTAAGIYKVEWRVLSTDGHKMKGSYQFSVKP